MDIFGSGHYLSNYSLYIVLYYLNFCHVYILSIQKIIIKIIVKGMWNINIAIFVEVVAYLLSACQSAIYLLPNLNTETLLSKFYK